MKKFGNGFTLIELLVAMVLLSMVTLLLAMAINIAIKSWEHRVHDGEDVQLWSAIPTLMEKQLLCRIINNPFERRSGKKLPFCGEKNGVSFFSSYSPQGSSWQGLLRVTYLFKEEEKILYIFEQLITRKEDLKTGFSPLSDQLEKEINPVSRIPHITDFSFKYSGQESHDLQEADEWKDSWNCVSTSLPTGIGIKLQIGEDSKTLSREWHFLLGPLLP